MQQFKFLAILLLSVSSSVLHADRIMVIGDSWARPVVSELQTVLHENGHINMSVDATPFMYTTRIMNTQAGLDKITTWLEERPDVTIVQMSTGANDWEESGWAPDWWGGSEEKSLFAQILRDTGGVVDHIRSLRPDIRILWSSYDFPRPLNNGTPSEINAFLIRLAKEMAKFADSRPGVSFVDIIGTLQVTYGFDGIKHTSFDPGFVIPPGAPSLPDAYLPSPLEPFLPNDRWHLTADGYKALAQAQYDGYYASQLIAGAFRMNAGLNDAWYNPDTDGQGFLITVFPELGVVSLAWFTYDTELPPIDATANLGDPGHRWLSAIGPIVDNQAVMNIEMTSGGIFDTPTDIQRTDPPGSDGTIVLTFDSCNSGTVEYDIPSINRQGTVPIQRVANDNIVICEALNSN